MFSIIFNFSPPPPPLPQSQFSPGCWKYSAPYRHQLKATIKEKQKELSEANSFLDLALSYFNFNPAEVSRQRSVLELDDTAHTPHRSLPHFLCFSRGAQQQPGGGQLGPGYRPFYPISRVILSPPRTPRSQYLKVNNVRHCISTAAHQHTSHRRFCSPGSPEQTFSKTNKEATISHLILGKFIHFLHFMWKRAFSLYIGGDHWLTANCHSLENFLIPEQSRVIAAAIFIRGRARCWWWWWWVSRNVAIISSSSPAPIRQGTSQ